MRRSARVPRNDRPFTKQVTLATIMTLMNHRNKTVFYFLMIVSMFFWGASWISAKSIAEVPATVSAFWRFFLMFISFLPLLIAGKIPRHFQRAGLVYTLLAALALVFYNILFFWGLKAGYAGKHGVLTTTLNPLFTFVWAAVFRMRHGDWLAWSGLGIGFLGGIIQLLGDSLSLSAFLDPTGLYFVLSAAVYALLTVFGQLAQRTVHLFLFSVILYGMATLLILPLSAGDGALLLTRWGRDFWWNILFIALFVGTFATTMYFYATREIGAARASSFTFTIPVTVVVLSYLILGEQPQVTSLVGGALSLIAVAMIQHDPQNGYSTDNVDTGGKR